MFDAQFKDNVALVVGAGSGMGRATAYRFARAGAKVVASDVSEEGGRETVENIRREGGRAEFVRTDISVADEVEHLMRSAVDHYGRIDYACNTAAIDIEHERLADCEDEIFDRVIAVNLRGTFLCMKHQVRQMLTQARRGSIVNFTSVAAYRSKGLHLSAYVASKAAVIALTRVAAMTYSGEAIKINTICPGPIDTPMLRGTFEKLGISVDELTGSYGLMGRLGRPEEIAEAVLWLCSDSSSYTVGCVLPVDGGAMIG